MIIAAPQMNDWGETSADQTIALTRWLLSAYNIDTSRVYIEGYSGGGETLSRVLDKAPELYTAAMMCVDTGSHTNTMHDSYTTIQCRHCTKRGIASRM